MGETETAALLLRSQAVLLRPGDPFTYASGIKSPIYCDNRTLLSLPAERNAIIHALTELVKDIPFDVVAGTATAGIAWAALLAERAGKPMIYVRKRAKEYGKGKQIEGTLREGQRVLLVEDLVTTGGSALAAVDSIRECGGTVTDCVAIFTYTLAQAAKGFAQRKCALHALTSLPALVEAAQDTLTEEQKRLVLAWKDNPEGWQ